MDELGIAVVGAGYWGPNLVRNFAACPMSRPVYICDRDLSRAARLQRSYPTAEPSDDYGRVLADSGVDAVAIATPVDTHFGLAKEALLAGKHVLVEKPLASTVAEGEELVTLAARNGLQLMCDHTFCYTGAVRKIRDVVGSGELGRILYFDSVRVNLGLFQSDVNVLWDLCPHDLSIIDYVFPEGLTPSAVAAHGLDAMGTGLASIAYLTLTFDAPLICHVHANWLSPVKVRTVLVGGTRKMILWDDNNPAERVRIYDKGVEVNNNDRERILVNYRHGNATIPVIDANEALSGMAEEFCTAIRERRPALTDGESGLRVLRVLEAANTSLASGGQSIDI